MMLHSPKSVVERRFFLSLGLSRSWLFGSYSSYYYCIAMYFFFSTSLLPILFFSIPISLFIVSFLFLCCCCYTFGRPPAAVMETAVFFFLFYSLSFDLFLRYIYIYINVIYFFSSPSSTFWNVISASKHIPPLFLSCQEPENRHL